MVIIPQKLNKSEFPADSDATGWAIPYLERQKADFFRQKSNKASLTLFPKDHLMYSVLCKYPKAQRLSSISTLNVDVSCIRNGGKNQTT